jgi:hypothetical protein
MTDFRRQFPRFTRLPRGVMPSQNEIQSSVPSQHPQTLPPFNPASQPDMPVPVRTTRRPYMNQGENPGVDLTPQEMADVRHVWDSRPINGYDFWLEDRFSCLPATPASFASFLGGYNVPDGYNLFLRHLSVSIWPSDDPALYVGGGGTGAAANNFMTKTGPLGVSFQLNAVPKMSLLIDGSPTPYWTAINQAPNGGSLPGIPLLNPGLYDYEIPCFVPVAGGSNVSASFTIELAANAIDPWIIMVQYYGNLISDTGRTLANEAGNGEPLPVVGEQS